MKTLIGGLLLAVLSLTAVSVSAYPYHHRDRVYVGTGYNVGPNSHYFYRHRHCTWVPAHRNHYGYWIQGHWGYCRW
jgi:hypothetical protein